MSLTGRDGQSFSQLVLAFGRDRARDLVDPNHRSFVDIAAEVLADEQQQIGISYTGFCLTSLPHKMLPDDQSWERRGHNVTLLVEPGTMRRNGQVVRYGVPYGARARMILLYLQTQAVKTRSREVELGRSMREWMERMNVAVGGETIKSLREQAARISACSSNSIGRARIPRVGAGGQLSQRAYALRAKMMAAILGTTAYCLTRCSGKH